MSGAGYPPGSHPLLNTVDLVGHALLFVDAGACLDRAGQPYHPHFVQGFVALLNSGKYRVPFSLHVGAVGVQIGFQPGFFKNLVAGGNVL